MSLTLPANGFGNTQELREFLYTLGCGNVFTNPKSGVDEVYGQLMSNHYIKIYNGTVVDFSKTDRKNSSRTPEVLNHLTGIDLTEGCKERSRYEVADGSHIRFVITTGAKFCVIEWSRFSF